MFVIRIKIITEIYKDTLKYFEFRTTYKVSRKEKFFKVSTKEKCLKNSREVLYKNQISDLKTCPDKF